jgi:hypothetical protein
MMNMYGDSIQLTDFHKIARSCGFELDNKRQPIPYYLDLLCDNR